MNIRIQTDQPSSASSATGRTDQISGGGSSGFKQAVEGKQNEDQVDVSPLTASITAATSGQAASRASRVTQLGALVASGQYIADGASVSQAMVAGAIGKSN